MRKQYTHLLLLLSLSLLIFAAGCGQAKKEGAGQKQGDQPSSIQATIKAYYGDPNGTQLQEKDRQVTYAAAEQKYITALNELRKTPDQQSVALCEKMTFHSAQLKDGLVTVDLSLSHDGHMGAPGEELTLQAIEKTLFQFDEVQTIEILLDGKKVESLMGHVELPYPIKRSQ